MIIRGPSDNVFLPMPSSGFISPGLGPPSGGAPYHPPTPNPTPGTPPSNPYIPPTPPAPPYAPPPQYTVPTGPGSTDPGGNDLGMLLGALGGSAMPATSGGGGNYATLGTPLDAYSSGDQTAGDMMAGSAGGSTGKIIFIAVIAAAAFFGYKWWRKRHPN